MKGFRLYVLLMAWMVTLFSCRREAVPDNIAIDLGGDYWVKTALDKWVYDSLTKPYNIDVKYKWDQSELPMDLVLVPPYEHALVPVLRDVVKLWVVPYNKTAADTNFIKLYPPKQIVLSGAPAMQTNGSAVNGVAEGGLKIVLHDVNSHNSLDSLKIAKVAQLIHHEYAHILNQKKAYPIAYKQVTPESYTGNWAAIKDNPWTLGFVSNYSRKEPGEDIAEFISFMLVMGKAKFDHRVNFPFPDKPNEKNNEKAIKHLRDKEKLIVDYFMESYNIDFYKLQTSVQQQIYLLLHP